MFTWRERKSNDQRDIFLRIHERLIDLDLQQGRRILARIHSSEDARDLLENRPGDYHLASRALAMLDVAGLYVEQGYVDKSLFIQEWGSVYSALHEGPMKLIAERAVRGPSYHTWSWPHFQALASEVHGMVLPSAPPRLPSD